MMTNISFEEYQEVTEHFWPAISHPDAKDDGFSSACVSIASSKTGVFLYQSATHILTNMMAENLEYDITGILRWKDAAIRDRSVFDVEAKLGDTIDRALSQFDSQIKRLKNRGIIATNYDTTDAFKAYLAIAVIETGLSLLESYKQYHEKGDKYFYRKEGFFASKIYFPAYQEYDNLTPIQMKNNPPFTQYDMEGLYRLCCEKFKDKFWDLMDPTSDIIQKMRNSSIAEIKDFFIQTYKKDSSTIKLIAYTQTYMLMDYVLNNR